MELGGIKGGTIMAYLHLFCSTWKLAVTYRYIALVVSSVFYL